MSHRAGLYRVLEVPGIYERFQSLLGGPAALRRLVDEYMRPSEDIRLLDVGCGAGSLLEYLPTTVRYVGFDINASCIDVARRRYGDRGRFFRARVGDEPPELDGSRYDLIVALGLLHHLSDADAAHLLGTAARLLAPGGAFVSVDGTFHEGQHWISRLMARLDRGSEVRTPDAYGRLAEPYFSEVQRWLLTDLLAVPYSYCVMRAVRP